MMILCVCSRLLGSGCLLCMLYHIIVWKIRFSEIREFSTIYDILKQVKVVILCLKAAENEILRDFQMSLWSVRHTCFCLEFQTFSGSKYFLASLESISSACISFLASPVFIFLQFPIISFSVFSLFHMDFQNFL